MTVGHVDLDNHIIQFESLKKRQQGRWRAVPVRRVLIEHLNLAFGLRRRQFQKQFHQPLWTYSRVTAWRHIKRLLDEAGIRVAQASPKGLRHQCR